MTILESLDAWLSYQDLEQPGTILGYPGFEYLCTAFVMADGTRISLDMLPEESLLDLYRPAGQGIDNYERIGTQCFGPDCREPLILLIAYIKAHGGLVKSLFMFAMKNEHPNNLFMIKTTREKTGKILHSMHLGKDTPIRHVKPQIAQCSDEEVSAVAGRCSLDPHFIDLVQLLFAV